MVFNLWRIKRRTRNLDERISVVKVTSTTQSLSNDFIVSKWHISAYIYSFPSNSSFYWTFENFNRKRARVQLLPRRFYVRGDENLRLRPHRNDRKRTKRNSIENLITCVNYPREANGAVRAVKHVVHAA